MGDLIDEQDFISPLSNIAIVSGIVERKPYYNEYRDKGKRQQYASFNLKIPRSFKDDTFDIIRIRAYEMNAIYVSENIFEGMGVEIQGELRPYSYTTDEGVKIWSMCVIIREIDITNMEQPQMMEEDHYVPIVFPKWMEEEMNEIFK